MWQIQNDPDIPTTAHSSPINFCLSCIASMDTNMIAWCRSFSGHDLVGGGANFAEICGQDLCYCQRTHKDQSDPNIQTKAHSYHQSIVNAVRAVGRLFGGTSLYVIKVYSSVNLCGIRKITIQFFLAELDCCRLPIANR